MTDNYTPQERALLLDLARRTLDAITHRQPAPTVDLSALPAALCEPRACFVTMRYRSDGALRGCTGTLVARRPLAEEVIYMTEQTAFHDPRFEPVMASDVDDLHLEISVLTPSQPLDFDSPEDLIAQLRPNVDGVTLKFDHRRATFLPQVWESYSDPKVFLSLLSQKMGAAPDTWRSPRLEVETYQAVIIEEEF
ncbi:MAG: AmmeMemoRadiSam system protein A [Chloroflexi bacterium]|nr:AmmeMemoRadiSam system protein A [Chloroflexota bacterium]